jgi:hypothetical protein
MTVLAHVRGTGQFYVSGDECLEIWVQKSRAAELPFVSGALVPVELKIDGASYEAGLRATDNNNYVWISPKMRDADGNAVRLSDVAKTHGLEKNQPVELQVNGKTLSLISRS